MPPPQDSLCTASAHECLVVQHPNFSYLALLFYLYIQVDYASYPSSTCKSGTLQNIMSLLSFFSVTHEVLIMKVALDDVRGTVGVCCLELEGMSCLLLGPLYSSRVVSICPSALVYFLEAACFLEGPV